MSALAKSIFVRCLCVLCFCGSVCELDDFSSEDVLGEAFGGVLAGLGDEERDGGQGQEGEEAEVAFDVGVGGAEEVLGSVSD
jgi:hypothetical protein